MTPKEKAIRAFMARHKEKQGRDTYKAPKFVDTGRRSKEIAERNKDSGKPHRGFQSKEFIKFITTGNRD